jgi:hypothetical protein
VDRRLTTGLRLEQERRADSPSITEDRSKERQNSQVELPIVIQIWTAHGALSLLQERVRHPVQQLLALFPHRRRLVQQSLLPVVG